MTKAEAAVSVGTEAGAGGDTEGCVEDTVGVGAGAGACACAGAGADAGTGAGASACAAAQVLAPVLVMERRPASLSGQQWRHVRVVLSLGWCTVTRIRRPGVYIFFFFFFFFLVCARIISIRKKPHYLTYALYVTTHSEANQACPARASCDLASHH